MEILRKNIELITCNLHFQKEITSYIHLIQLEQNWGCTVLTAVHEPPYSLTLIRVLKKR